MTFFQYTIPTDEWTAGFQGDQFLELRNLDDHDLETGHILKPIARAPVSIHAKREDAQPKQKRVRADWLDNIENPTLQLSHPLQTGLARWSQVWLVDIHSNSAGALSSPKFVLKLYRDSSMPLPRNNPELWGPRWTAGAELAENEWSAYCALGELQGQLVMSKLALCVCSF